MLCFKRTDFIRMAQGQTDVIKAIDHTIFTKIADIEFKDRIACAHELFRQINRDFKTHLSFGHIE